MAKIADSPLEAAFRAFARERADYILAPERTDDRALKRALRQGADPAEYRSAIRLMLLREAAPTRKAAIRAGTGKPFRGYYVHYRNPYIVALIAVAVAAGIRRPKARRIIGDEFGMEIAEVRKIDGKGIEVPPKARH